jgi:transcriptional regulator with XRE-family HTH domain
MTKTIPSGTAPARVRAYFGLTQDELADYLGVTRGAVSHAERRRIAFGPAVWLQLLPLAQHLPPTTELAPPAATTLPEEELPGQAADPIRRRLQACRREARRLRTTLEAWYQAYQQAQRWQQVLPQLLALLPDSPAADSPGQQRQRRWLARHSTTVADALDELTLTEGRVLQLRLRHLEAEATELHRWLAGG